MFGRVLIPLIGLTMVTFAYFISFVPSNILTISHLTYLLILILSYVFVIIMPHILYFFRNDNNKEKYKIIHNEIPKHQYLFHLRGRKPFVIKNYDEEKS